MPDFESLYNESQANAFTSAKKRFYDNKVDNLNEENYDGKTVIQAVVHGHRDYHTSIVFDEQGGLYDYSCDCYGFSMQSGPCKHILATALTYEEKKSVFGRFRIGKKKKFGRVHSRPYLRIRKKEAGEDTKRRYSGIFDSRHRTAFRRFGGVKIFGSQNEGI